MSVCSAVAASHRPSSGRRESRSSSTRASTSDAHYHLEKGGLRAYDQRKYSTVSQHKHQSSSALCCVISVVMCCIAIGWFESGIDFIG